MNKLDRFIEISRYFGSDYERPPKELFREVLADLIGPLELKPSKVINEPVLDRKFLKSPVDGGLGDNIEQDCVILKDLGDKVLIELLDDYCPGEMDTIYIVDKSILK